MAWRFLRDIKTNTVAWAKYHTIHILKARNNNNKKEFVACRPGVINWLVQYSDLREQIDLSEEPSFFSGLTPDILRIPIQDPYLTAYVAENSVRIQ